MEESTVSFNLAMKVGRGFSVESQSGNQFVMVENKTSERFEVTVKKL